MRFATQDTNNKELYINNKNGAQKPRAPLSSFTIFLNLDFTILRESSATTIIVATTKSSKPIWNRIKNILLLFDKLL